MYDVHPQDKIAGLLIQFRLFGSRTSFSPAASTNVRISPQNFLILIFNQLITSASPKLLNLNQDHSSKKVVFLVKSL